MKQFLNFLSADGGEANNITNESNNSYQQQQYSLKKKCDTDLHHDSSTLILFPDSSSDLLNNCSLKLHRKFYQIK